MGPFVLMNWVQLPVFAICVVVDKALCSNHWLEGSDQRIRFHVWCLGSTWVSGGSGLGPTLRTLLEQRQDQPHQGAGQGGIAAIDHGQFDRALSIGVVDRDPG